MDVTPADKFELEERHEEDADDDFAGTVPDVPEETETTFIDYLEDSEFDLERAKTNIEIDEFYDSFPEYDVDIIKKYVIKKILAWILNQIG